MADATPHVDPAPPDRRVLGGWLRTRQRDAAAPLRRAGMLAALAGALVVPQAWLLAHAIAPVVVAHATLADVLPWLLPVPLVLVVRFVLAHAADRAALAGALAIETRLRDDLVKKMQALGPAWVRERATGALATTVVEGIEALRPYYVRFVPNLAVVAALPLAILAVVLPRDWISGLVLFVTAPVIPLFMVVLGHGAERLNQRQWRTLARLSARLLDALQRLTTIKLFDAAEREASLLARNADAYRRETMAVLRRAFLSSLALEFFATVGIALVAVLVGFRLLEGQLAFEVGLFALLLAPEFYAPLRRLGSDYHARMEAIAAAEGIVEILDAPFAACGSERPALGRDIAIRCEDLHFAYDAQDVLRGVTLTLAPRSVTALVGRSGAGKSTLLSLLCLERRPAGGRILVADHDLADVDPAYWRAQVALVPQRPHVFAGTIGDNVRLARPDASDEDVARAFEAAAATGFVRALPQGLATALGEHGHTLSGGQLQRLALARAFLKDAPVVLVDEGTAGLDRENEEAIGDALARLARERTVLVIAHRLRTVMRANHVLVLDAGRIVEEGAPAVLARTGGAFAQMIESAGLAS